MASQAQGAARAGQPAAAARRGRAQSAGARTRQTLLDGATYLLVGILAAVALFPFYWMLRTAFTPRRAAFSLHPTV